MWPLFGTLYIFFYITIICKQAHASGPFSTTKSTAFRLTGGPKPIKKVMGKNTSCLASDRWLINVTFSHNKLLNKTKQCIW